MTSEVTLTGMRHKFQNRSSNTLFAKRKQTRDNNNKFQQKPADFSAVTDSEIKYFDSMQKRIKYVLKEMSSLEQGLPLKVESIIRLSLFLQRRIPPFMPS